MRMNLFKPAIRGEIYLFMFVLGGLALLKEPLHRGEESEDVDGRVNAISNERAPRPPTFKLQNRPAGPAQSPTTCSGEAEWLYCISSPPSPFWQLGDA